MLKKKFAMLSFILILVYSLSFLFAANTQLVTIPNSSLNPDGSLNDFSSSVAKTLSEQVVIPSVLESLAKVLFNLDSSRTIDLQTFIIYFVLWIILLLIIESILEIFPLLGEGWKSWLGAIVITALISITGSIKSAAIWFFSFGKLITQTSFLWIVFDLLLLILLGVGFISFFKTMKHKVGEAKARTIGMKTGMP